MSDNKQPNPDLHVFSDDAEWYVAADRVDAASAWRKFTGSTVLYAPDFEQLPDDKPLTITIEDEGKATKTCGEWARENGRGFLASTEG